MSHIKRSAGETTHVEISNAKDGSARGKNLGVHKLGPKTGGMTLAEEGRKKQMAKPGRVGAMAQERYS